MVVSGAGRSTMSKPPQVLQLSLHTHGDRDASHASRRDDFRGQDPHMRPLTKKFVLTLVILRYDINYNTVLYGHAVLPQIQTHIIMDLHTFNHHCFNSMFHLYKPEWRGIFIY